MMSQRQNSTFTPGDTEAGSSAAMLRAQPNMLADTVKIDGISAQRIVPQGVRERRPTTTLGGATGRKKTNLKGSNYGTVISSDLMHLRNGKSNNVQNASTPQMLVAVDQSKAYLGQSQLDFDPQ